MSFYSAPDLRTTSLLSPLLLIPDQGFNCAMGPACARVKPLGVMVPPSCLIVWMCCVQFLVYRSLVSFALDRSLVGSELK